MSDANLIIRNDIGHHIIIREDVLTNGNDDGDDDDGHFRACYRILKDNHDQLP